MDLERIADVVKDAKLRKKELGKKGRWIYPASYYEDLTDEERAEVRKQMKGWKNG